MKFAHFNLWKKINPFIFYGSPTPKIQKKKVFLKFSNTNQLMKQLFGFVLFGFVAVGRKAMAKAMEIALQLLLLLVLLLRRPRHTHTLTAHVHTHAHTHTEWVEQTRRAVGNAERELETEITFTHGHSTHTGNTRGARRLCRRLQSVWDLPQFLPACVPRRLRQQRQRQRHRQRQRRRR